MDDELIDALLDDRKTYAKDSKRVKRIDAQLAGLGYTPKKEKK